LQLDRHKQFVLALGVLEMATVVGLSAVHETRLEIYVIMFTICYFASSTLLRPRRRWFDVVGMALFLAFCYIGALNLLELLSRIV
jgi:CHASE2 domain-containing sensor protein